jgi:hypothetical protein
MQTDARADHHQGGVEVRMSAPVGAAAGLGLAAVMLAPLLFISKLAGMQFLAVQLGFIGAIYFGFAIANGGLNALLIEFSVSGVFLLAGAVALWSDSPVFLAAAYATHAAWDLVHHPRAVQMPVRNWYPPFCVVYDIVFAAFILLWLPLDGVA